MDSLKNYLSFLSQSPWINLVSVAIGIFGIVLSTYFFLRSKSYIYPRFQKAGAALVASGIKNIDGLRILYRDRELTTLSLATVSFWNQGRRVLNSADMAPTEPLRIELPPGTTILQARVGETSSPSNNVKVKVRTGEPTIDIQFDYLAGREGFTVEIFHDNISPNCPELKGTIKGFGSAQEVMKNDDPISNNFVRPIYNRIYNLTGGPDRAVYWILSPIWILPLFIAALIDNILKPVRFILDSNNRFSAQNHLNRFK
ncbi:MAG: hypothetical protein KDJ24_04610 [Gammaproteobacteria bacterium]|nr:hypothetical protein [Gammaproteobacteria bacterium]